MPDPEVVDGTVEEPTPELKEAVDDRLPAVVVSDTVHAVQDIVQRMNWTGKAKIGLLLDQVGRPVMEVEVVEADEGRGLEPFYVATTYAKDEITGMVMPGASMEPQNMRLKNGSVKFDRFARTKAIQKATRNAFAAFIPEEIEQTVIAMFVKDSARVERIRTEAEQKVAELPPPLDDDEAKTLIASCEMIYEDIKQLGGGRGKVKLTPGTYNAWMMQSQHSHDRLRGFVEYLSERQAQIPGELLREDQEREAVESANTIACPKCEAPPREFCKGVRGAHGERVRARLEQIQAATS
jgi:hypothetical protein